MKFWSRSLKKRTSRKKQSRKQKNEVSININENIPQNYTEPD